MKDHSIQYALILGMAMQAVIASTLSSAGLINLCAGQQLIAGVLYIIVFVCLITVRSWIKS